MSQDEAENRLISNWNNANANPTSNGPPEPNWLISVVIICILVALIPIYLLGVLLMTLAKKALSKLRRRRSVIIPEPYKSTDQINDQVPSTAKVFLTHTPSKALSEDMEIFVGPAEKRQRRLSKSTTEVPADERSLTHFCSCITEEKDIIRVCLDSKTKDREIKFAFQFNDGQITQLLQHDRLEPDPNSGPDNSKKDEPPPKPDDPPSPAPAPPPQKETSEAPAILPLPIIIAETSQEAPADKEEAPKPVEEPEHDEGQMEQLRRLSDPEPELQQLQEEVSMEHETVVVAPVPVPAAPRKCKKPPAPAATAAAAGVAAAPKAAVVAAAAPKAAKASAAPKAAGSCKKAATVPAVTVTPVVVPVVTPAGPETADASTEAELIVALPVVIAPKAAPRRLTVETATAASPLIKTPKKSAGVVTDPMHTVETKETGTAVTVVASRSESTEPIPPRVADASLEAAASVKDGSSSTTQVGRSDANVAAIETPVARRSRADSTEAAAPLVSTAAGEVRQEFSKATNTEPPRPTPVKDTGTVPSPTPTRTTADSGTETAEVRPPAAVLTETGTQPEGRAVTSVSTQGGAEERSPEHLRISRLIEEASPPPPTAAESEVLLRIPASADSVLMLIASSGTSGGGGGGRPSLMVAPVQEISREERASPRISNHDLKARKSKSVQLSAVVPVKPQPPIPGNKLCKVAPAKSGTSIPKATVAAAAPSVQKNTFLEAQSRLNALMQRINIFKDKEDQFLESASGVLADLAIDSAATQICSNSAGTTQEQTQQCSKMSNDDGDEPSSSSSSSRKRRASSSKDNCTGVKSKGNSSSKKRKN